MASCQELADDRRALCAAGESAARRRRKTPPVERREARVPDRKGTRCASHAHRAASPAAQGLSQSPAFLGAPLPSLFLAKRAKAQPARHDKRAAERWLFEI